MPNYTIEFQGRDRTGPAFRSLNQNLDRTQRNSRATQTALTTAFRATAIIAGATVLARSISNVTSALAQASVESTQLQRTMTALTRSTALAGTEINRIAQFSRQYGINLRDAESALVKFTQFGLDASNEALVNWIGTAEASGKSLDQLAEAVADALTGEFERFKEFGIKVRREGSQLVATLSSGNQVVANSYRGLIEKLQDAGKAYEDLADKSSTLEGSQNKLSTEFTLLKRNLSEIVKGPLKDMNDGLAGILNKINTKVESGSLGELWDRLNYSARMAELGGNVSRAGQDIPVPESLVDPNWVPPSDPGYVRPADLPDDARLERMINDRTYGRIGVRGDQHPGRISMDGVRAMARARQEADKLAKQELQDLEELKDRLSSLGLDLIAPEQSTQIHNFADGLATINEAFDKGFFGMEAYNELLERLSNNLGEVHPAAESALAKFAYADESGGRRHTLPTSLNEFGGAGPDINVEETQRKTAAYAKERLRSIEQEKQETMRLQRTWDRIEATLFPINALKKDQVATENEINRLAALGVITEYDRARAIAKSTEEYEEAMQRVAELTKTEMEKVGDSIAMAFSESLAKGEQSFSSFFDHVNNLAQDLLARFINQQLIAPLFSSIGGALGLGDLFAGFFHTGGTIPAGKFGITRSDEAITYGPANVHSPAQTNMMKDNGPVVMNFNINAMDSRDVEEVLYDKKDFIVGMYNQALNESGNRGIYS